MSIKISEVIHFLNELAPPSLQESYDNAGLLVGDADWDCSGVLVCLDSLEPVLDEALANGCNLIVAHHPIIFSGLKKITGKNYIEKTIIKAIKNEVAIFAIHTNLDAVIEGVNGKMATQIGLQSTKVLSPKKNLFSKLITFVPPAHLEKVQTALFEAGAGTIGNYDQCSFSTSGVGTFRALEGAQPFVGKKGEMHTESELRLEVLYPNFKEKAVLQALKNNHPYEEVAYDCVALSTTSNQIGSGIIGQLAESVPVTEFLHHIKSLFKVAYLKHTALTKKEVKKIAYCGGSGSFLLNDAIAQGADVFITADFKYHDYFDANDRILIVDIGHYESEFLTINLLVDKMKEKFTTFCSLVNKREYESN